MEKLIRIEFELENNQRVVIYGYDENLEKKEIGCIFTPSNDNVNCIQICGFSEAFDLWGCARYQVPLTDDPREKIVYGLEGKKIPKIQAKDIQLFFDINTIPTPASTLLKGWDIDECSGCYNIPCTCENKIHEKNRNPYKLKREKDVPVLTVKDYLGEKYEYIDNNLVRKDGKEKK